MRFLDGATFKEIPYGHGRIFWSAYPVEMAEGTDAAAEVYRYVAAKVGITPLYDLAAPTSSGILVYPIILQDSVLYVLESDSADDADIDFRDQLTGARIALRLPAQHAALALVGKQTKAVIARYGF